MTATSEFDHQRFDDSADYRDGYTALFNDICMNVPESWDDDGFDVVAYVREIERRLLARGGSLECFVDEEGHPYAT